MKKILSLLMIAVLVVSLSVSAFASETIPETMLYNDIEYPNIDKVWTDKVTYPKAVIYQLNSVTYLWLVADFDRAYLESGLNPPVLYFANSDKQWQSKSYVSFSLDGDTWVLQQNDTASGFGHDAWIWSNFDIERSYSSNTIKYSASEPVEIPICDGSTCPATDLNYDGICDDCGVMLLYSIRPFPSIESIWDKNTYPYGLLYQSNSGTSVLYFMDNPLTSADGVGLRFNGGNFVVYNLTDGTWVHQRDGSGAVEFPDIDSGQILKVSHPLKYNGTVVFEADTNFFPTPLWEMMDKVTQGEMTGLQATTGGTMKVLALCGVGLIASLVVLSLFGKRSLIFRN